jgi:hypothetical protein
MKNTLRLLGLTGIVALVLAFGSPTAFAAFAGGVTLGSAGPGNYALLSLGGQGSNSDAITHTNVAIANVSTITGNVGIAGTGDIATSGNAFITGTLFLNTAGTWNQSGTSNAGAVSQSAATDAKLNQAVQDALNASSQAAALSSTQPSITSIALGANGTMTITGTGQDVINLTSFSLGNNSVLTLNAPAGDSFIFNISGAFTMQGKVMLIGGISPADVLWNVTGTGAAVAFSGGGNSAQLVGILLAPFRDIQLSPGLVTGEVIGGGLSISLSGGANINAIPEPSTTALLILASLLVVGRAFFGRRTLAAN